MLANLLNEFTKIAAERTGYAPDLLLPDLHLATDLGIDQIKLAEILELFLKKFAYLPTIEFNEIENLDTLDKVATYLNQKINQFATPAIISGLAIYTDSCQTLSRFNSAIYKNQPLLSITQNQTYRDLAKEKTDESYDQSLYTLVEQTLPEQKILYKVADAALADAGFELKSNLATKKRVAVITMLGGSYLTESEQALSYFSAAAIQRVWGLTAPNLAIEPTQAALLRSLRLACNWLGENYIDAILVVGVETLTRGQVVAAALVIEPGVTATKNYAFLTKITNQETTESDLATQQADYIEFCALPTPLKVATGSCAVGQLNYSSQITQPGSFDSPVFMLIGLIKTALCLYHRYLPSVTDYANFSSLALTPKGTTNSTEYYIPPKAQPWFVTPPNNHRKAVVWSSNGFIQLQDNPQQAIKVLNNEPLVVLLTIAGDNLDELQNGLRQYQNELNETDINISNLEKANLELAHKQLETNYKLALVGQSRPELLKEIEISLSPNGIRRAFERNVDWKTPAGSYLTMQPVGKQAAIAFVYPGAFSSYPGLGQELFYWYPQSWHSFSEVTNNIGQRYWEKLLYPRSLTPPTPKQQEIWATELIQNLEAMLESGVSVAYHLTTILQDYYALKPTLALGYSMGEISMLLATRAWKEGDFLSRKLAASNLFKTRLAGPKEAVREFWQLPASASTKIWSNYVLLTEAAKVKAALKTVSKVYLTHINTPQEVVIGGEPAACLNFIDKLNCEYLRAPFNEILHCEVINSEYNSFVEMFKAPFKTKQDFKYLFQHSFNPEILNEQLIAHNISRDLCQVVDFPNLVERAYANNIKIFIEVGAGNTCSRWISSILGKNPHLAVSADQPNLNSHISLQRMKARLLSHQILDC